MNVIIADFYRAIDSVRYAYRLNKSKAKILGLLLFAASLVVVDMTNPVHRSPLNDGAYCVYTAASYEMCKFPGDYSPRYYITPDGEKLLARW